jgi:hypothetical protein
MIRETASLQDDIGTASAEVSGLFKGVRELEDAEVLLVAAYNLEADGQAFRRESCGHRNSGIAGSRDVPAGFHPWQSVTVNGNPTPGLDPSLDLLSNMMFSKAIQHNNPNPTKGAQPVRGKDGKITGWTLPGKGNKSGQRVPKTLQWGRENGLNPDDPRWTKMAVGVGAAAAGGLTVMQILEYGAAGALAF